MGLYSELPSSALSAAAKQQIGILRVLLRDRSPQFLLLDEPTARLSRSERQTLFVFLRSVISQGTGVLLVSHRPDDAAELCQTVSFIENGRIRGTLPVSHNPSQPSSAEVVLPSYPAESSHAASGNERAGTLEVRLDPLPTSPA